VRHLALCLSVPGEYPKESILLGQPEKGSGIIIYHYIPVVPDTARACLQELLSFYGIGQREPLLLFPSSSMAFVQRLSQCTGAVDQQTRDQALCQARKIWEEGDNAEGSDMYNRRVFGGVDPFEEGFSLFPAMPMAGGSFCSLAMRVFGPMLAHRREDA
jgi:exonuclease V gamma subunit